MDGSGGVLIGGAHDPAEKAADRMAAQALSGRSVTACGGGGVAVHRECAKCTEEKEAKRNASPGATVASGASSARATASASNAINGLGAGRPLSKSERSFFEPRFGRDFSNVRVHEDTAADKAANAIDARAFAYGDDIAFAKGERAKGGDRLMAHELAHVVQEDGDVWRSIKAKAPGQFQTHLIDEYKADAPEIDGDLLKAAGRKDSGPLMEQCAQNMLASSRVFEIDGADHKANTQSLSDHIASREGIVDFAKTLEVNFAIGKPDFGPEMNRLIFDDFYKSLIDFQNQLVAKGKSVEEAADLARQHATDELLIRFNKIVGTPDFSDAMRKIIEDSEMATAGLGPKAFASACFEATSLVFFGGGESEVARDTVDSKNRSLKEPGESAWSDWIPGDWGYLRNTKPRPVPAGQEGENIIYIGDGQFWAHFSSVRTIMDMSALIVKLSKWGKMEASSIRHFPANGLKS